jgi:hypothetical protein
VGERPKIRDVTSSVEELLVGCERLNIWRKKEDDFDFCFDSTSGEVGVDVAGGGVGGVGVVVGVVSMDRFCSGRGANLIRRGVYMCKSEDEQLLEHDEDGNCWGVSLGDCVGEFSRMLLVRIMLWAKKCNALSLFYS